jgi:Ca2+:H+ antiporter
MLKSLSWAVVVPLVALVASALTWGREIGPLPVVLVTLLLAAAVLAAVQHAEVVATASVNRSRRYCSPSP